MAVYLISDTHFDHANIIRYRPQFSSIEEHDETIKENILSVVGKRDTLYILGDVALGPNGYFTFRDIVQNVEYCHVVLGNHDLERKGSITLEEFRTLCKHVCSMKRYREAWLSHAPIHPDELRGKFNIHGHVHANSLDDPRYFNVSCEAVDYKPINMVSVLEQLRDRND